MTYPTDAMIEAALAEYSAGVTAQTSWHDIAKRMLIAADRAAWIPIKDEFSEIDTNDLLVWRFWTSKPDMEVLPAWAVNARWEYGRPLPIGPGGEQ